MVSIEKLWGRGEDMEWEVRKPQQRAESRGSKDRETRGDKRRADGRMGE